MTVYVYQHVLSGHVLAVWDNVPTYADKLETLVRFEFAYPELECEVIEIAVRKTMRY